MAEPLIDIRPDHWVIVRDILHKRVPQYEVWAFGSRAKWNAKQYSDLDLAVITNVPLSLRVSGALADGFAESDLPFKVDVVDWATTGVSFREIIERDKVVVQKAQDAKKVGIAEGWKTLPLEDCMDAIIDYRGKTPEKTTFGIPLVTAKVIKGGRIERPDEFIAEADFDVWMRRGMPKRGDIVMTTEAPLGEVAQLDGTKIALAQRVITLRGKPDLLDNTFLKFLLQSDEVQEELRSRGTGTTVVGIRQSELRKVSLTLPPFTEQKAIASVLGALDDKIELNRRMNATLEAMARALFQSWFVDFDPVRAKLDDRPPANLDPATAALFPDSFQESSIGPIPQGWSIKTLGETIELAYGKPLKAEDRKYGPVCVYGANGPVGWHHEKLVAGPGIVVGRKGNPGVVTWAPGDFYPIDTTFYVVPIAGCTSLYFLYYALSLHNLANLSADSAVPGLNRKHAYMSQQVIPSAEVLKTFDAQIVPLFDAIYANEDESRTLATLRDTLLPKLLSGAISLNV